MTNPVNKELILVLPAMDSPILRVLVYLFLRRQPGTFSLFIIPALTPPEYKVTIVNQKLSWKEKDFVGGRLVGLSCVTANAVSCYAIADKFRKAGSKVVMGGSHASNLPDEALQHCDAIVHGEAESVWLQVVRDYENGELKKIYHGEALEDYFSPCFDYFMRLEPSKLFDTGIILSRGCKYHCEFCAPIAGKKVRFIKMAQAMAMIERIVKAQPRPFGIKPTIVFRDDNLFSSPAYFKELFQKMIPLKVRWNGSSSLDIAFDEEALTLAKASGCRYLFVGFESIKPAKLPKTSVGGIRTAEDLLKAIRKIKAHGIKVTGSFILGWDDDTPLYYLKMVIFWMRAGFEVVSLTMLTPFPGTMLFKKMEADNRILTRDWRKYDSLDNVVFKPKSMSPLQLRVWYLVLRVAGIFASRSFIFVVGMMFLAFLPSIIYLLLRSAGL